MSQIIQKYFSVHQKNIQVTITRSLSFLCVCKIIIIYTIINYVLLESIEQDQELDKYHIKQNNTSYTEDLVDKTVKILPPHIEELKRQVSL